MDAAPFLGREAGLAALAATPDEGVPADRPEAIAVLDTAAYLSERLGAWMGGRNQLDEAAVFLDHALAVRTRLTELDPTPWRDFGRGRAWAARARLAWARAEPDAPDPAAWAALADAQAWLDLAQADAHLAEADAAYAAVPLAARWLVAASMAALEDVRAHWFERTEDVEAAAAARARAAAFERAMNEAVVVRGGAAVSLAASEVGAA